MSDAASMFHSLGLRTDIGVLFDDVVCTPHDGFVAVETPSNPFYFWGNLLVFPAPPGPGERDRWIELWNETFGERFDHRTFTWDTEDGEEGDGESFVELGYRLERNVVLVAAPDAVTGPAKDTSHVQVRELDLATQTPGLIDLSIAATPDQVAAEGEERHRAYQQRQFARRQRAVQADKGFWLGAIIDTGEIVAALGVLDVGGAVARYQHVDTHPDWRRQGLCSRLVYEAAQLAGSRLGARELVIAADREYHALDLYRKLGFADRELNAGVCLTPAAARSAVSDGTAPGSV